MFFLLVTQNFRIKPVDQKVLFASTVVFNCVSEGQPKPQTSWQISLKTSNKTFAVNKTTKIDDKHEMLDNGSLVLRNVSDKSEGTYTCISESPGLIRTTSGLLTIYGMYKLFPYLS